MATADRTDGFENAVVKKIAVEVIYAEPDTIWRRELHLAAGAVVRDALRCCGFFEHFPAYSLETVQTGIYGQLCGHDRLLEAGDRVEVYRPLVFDPMESRRRRASHRQRNR